MNRLGKGGPNGKIWLNDEDRRVLEHITERRFTAIKRASALPAPNTGRSLARLARAGLVVRMTDGYEATPAGEVARNTGTMPPAPEGWIRSKPSPAAPALPGDPQAFARALRAARQDWAREAAALLERHVARLLREHEGQPSYALARKLIMDTADLAAGFYRASGRNVTRDDVLLGVRAADVAP